MSLFWSKPAASPLTRHQTEIQRNREQWRAKALLPLVYADFYRRLLSLVDATVSGLVVEMGSGLGQLKEHLPSAICTDLFPNPWLDVVCDGYELPFRDRTVSHLILMDVFHHLCAPNAFLAEARRVLADRGRVLLFEPYISWSSRMVYGLFHPEPVAWRAPFDWGERPSRPRSYYAAQGNATRLFFRREVPGWPAGWRVFHAEAIAGFAYLLSGGFSRPALYPRGCLGGLQRIDAILSRWPTIWAARCLVGLTPNR